MHKRVDGLINMPTDTTGEHLKPALDTGIPIVLVDRMLKAFSGKVSAVVVDNVDASEKATRHLLEAGHKEIGADFGQRGHLHDAEAARGVSQRLRGIRPRLRARS